MATNLQQLIDRPARITIGCDSLIDLIITSSTDTYLKSGCRDCCLSDHQMIFAVKKDDTSSIGTIIRQYRAFVSVIRWLSCEIWRKYHGRSYRPLMTLKIGGITGNSCSSPSWMNMSHLEHRCRRKQLPWITEEIRGMMKARNRLWKKD